MEIRELSEGQRDLVKILTDPMLDPDIKKDSVESLSDEDFAAIINDFADHVNELRSAKAAVSEQIGRLTERKNDFQRREDNDRYILEQLLRLRGKRKVETELYSVSIQRNGGLAPLEIDGDIEDIPPDYLIEHAPTPDKDKIRELLKTETVSWAHLEERGESLRIK